MGVDHVSLGVASVLCFLLVSSSASGAIARSDTTSSEIAPESFGYYTPRAIQEALSGTWSPNVLLTNGTLCCNTQTEPHAAVDKLGRLVVGWKEASSDTGGGQEVGWTYSHDGGATWSTPKDLSGGSDIVFAVDAQNNIYLNRLGGGCGGQSNAICTYKSTDGGVTWGTPVLSSFETRGGLHDKNWIASDGTKLYQLYEPKDTNYPQATLSVDGGATFTGDYRVGDGTSTIAGPIVIANRAGGAAACFIRSGNIYFDKSADGIAWGTDVLIGAGSTTGPDIYKQIPLCMMVQDSTGRFYVAYPANGVSKDIVVKTSTDGGSTWSSAVTVNDVGTGDQWHVQGYMCVDSKDKVHIGWRDERTAGTMEMYYANSTDGGATWSPNIKITDAPTSTTFNRPGEYGALVCGPDDTLYAAWADGRPDGNSYLDIYFSKMTQGGGGGNSAPAAPAITGPSTGVTNTSYSYNSSSVDPETDQVKITIDWGDSTSDTSALVDSGQNVQLAHAWSAKGVYAVKAMATDSKGAASAGGAPLQVTIDWKGGAQNNAPLAPTLAGPSAGQMSQSLSFTVQGTDPDNDQVKYTVDWGDTKTDVGSLVNSGASSSFSHAWTATGSYQVKAKTTDDNGVESAWGAAMTVIVTDTPDDMPPAILHTPVTEADAGAPIHIEATITDDVGVASADLFYKPDGASSFTKQAMNAPGPTTIYKASIPASEVKGARLEYYIEATDAAANIARDPVAGPSAPHVVKIRVTGSDPVGTSFLTSPTGLLLLLVLSAVIVGSLAILTLRRRKGNPAGSLQTQTYVPSPDEQSPYQQPPSEQPRYQGPPQDNWQP